MSHDDMPSVARASETSVGSALGATVGYAGVTVMIGALLVWEIDMMPSVLRRPFGAVGGDVVALGITLLLGFAALRRLSRRIRRAARLASGVRSHFTQAGLLYAYLGFSIPWLAANAQPGRPTPPLVLCLTGAVVAVVAVAADLAADRDARLMDGNRADSLRTP